MCRTALRSLPQAVHPQQHLLVAICASHHVPQDSEDITPCRRCGHCSMRGSHSGCLHLRKPLQGFKACRGEPHKVHLRHHTDLQAQKGDNQRVGPGLMMQLASTAVMRETAMTVAAAAAATAPQWWIRMTSSVQSTAQYVSVVDNAQHNRGKS